MIRILFPLRKAPIRLIGLLFVTMFASLHAHAHELRPAIADVSLNDGRYTATIALNLEAMMAGIGPEHEDTESAPTAATYDGLRARSPESLREAFGEFEAALIEKVAMKAGGVRLSPEIADLVIPASGDTELARETVLTLAAVLPSGAKDITFAWDEKFGPIILRVPGLKPDDLYSTYLQDGAASEAIPIAAPPVRSVLGTVKDYIYLGYTHILPKGLDHILFVIGLFLLSPALGPLLWQISTFTLAHTVTLAMGTMGIITLSPSVVEPLIAASIVYVCVENIFSDRLSPWRPLVVFAFGLLHGLGFAGVLGEIGMPQSQFVTALISFNVGVELGQLTVVALCFFVVGLWFRHKPWYRSAITIPASAAIALVGAYWTMERLFFA